MAHAQETTKAVIRSLAHEIKNPLAGVRGAAQLLARELPNEELKEYTEVIIREADRLRDLVDRLLGSICGWCGRTATERSGTVIAVFVALTLGFFALIPLVNVDIHPYGYFPPSAEVRRDHMMGPRTARVVLGNEFDDVTFDDALSPTSSGVPMVVADKRAAAALPDLMTALPAERQYLFGAGERQKSAKLFARVVDYNAPSLGHALVYSPARTRLAVLRYR